MGEYTDGHWKRVNGERIYIVVREGIFFRKVMIRDGKYSALDDTLEYSRVWKNRTSVETQLARTIEEYAGKQQSIEQTIDDVVQRMNEVYETDW